MNETATPAMHLHKFMCCQKAIGKQLMIPNASIIRLTSTDRRWEETRVKPLEIFYDLVRVPMPLEA